MAYQDALFQLGMDLPRSSTAQKEDSIERAPIAQTTAEAREDFYLERDGVRFAGTHLIIDLFGAKRLDDIQHVERTLKRCVDASGATLLHMHLHHLAPTGGVTGVAVLKESHISIHSWPGTGYAALDVFMSGDAKPHEAIAVLKDAFGADSVVVKEHMRGEAGVRPAWQAAAPVKKRASVRKPRTVQTERIVAAA